MTSRYASGRAPDIPQEVPAWLFDSLGAEWFLFNS